MPAISRIRFTNVIYEGGGKRYNDMIFHFDGLNSVFLLENGGGKTVFIQTALQAIIPHIDMADRKIKDTLSLEGNPAHIAIEWILNDSPRRYGVTAVSLYLENNALKSLKYVYEYAGDDGNSIEAIPFVIKMKNGKKRPASRAEIAEYYDQMKNKSLNAHIFRNINEYGQYLEENFQIIPSEWRKIATINSGEGNVEEYFNRCKTTQQLLNNLLIPTVEEAMQRESTKDFVTTFEKQREHFKTNKRLLQEIEQFKMIKNRVDDYVAKYKGLYDATLDYNEIKQAVKALKLHVTSLIEQNEKQQEAIRVKKEQLEAERYRNKHKEKSLEIRLLEEEINTFDLYIKELNEELARLQNRYNQQASRKQNIEISGLNQELESAKLQIESYEKQLEEVERNVDFEELKAQLDINSENIRGYFVQSLEKVEKQIQLIESQLSRERDEELRYKALVDESTQQERELDKEISTLVGKSDTLLESMQNIEKEVLDHYQKESIHEMYAQWQHRIRDLENQKRSKLERRSVLKSLLTSIQENIQENASKKAWKLEQLIKEQASIEQIEKAQKELIIEIESKSHNLFISDTIYSKEESVISSLDSKRIRLKEKVEEALSDERTHMRLADLYKNSDVFMADPLVEKAIEKIQSEVGFICHGVNHLPTMMELTGMSEDELFRIYPLWTITVVTTAVDLPKVAKYMEKYQGEMTHPLLIITNDELNQVFKGNASGGKLSSVGQAQYPFTWKDNLVLEDYHKWQKDIVEQAEYYKKTRQEQQKEYEVIRDVYNQAVNFFKMFPYESYTQLVDLVKELKEEVEQLEVEKNQQSETKVNYEKEEEQIQQFLEEATGETNLLTTKIQRCQEYMRLEKKYNNHKATLVRRKEKLVSVERAKAMNERNYDAQRRMCEELEYTKKDYLNDKNAIETDRLYMETKDCMPCFDLLERQVLENQRRAIEDQIRGIDKDRNAIIELLKKEHIQKERLQNNLNLKISEALYPIEEITVYREGELNELIEKLRALGPELEEVKRKVSVERDKKLKSEAIKEQREKEVLKDFDFIVEFQEELSEVKDDIKEEEKRLNQRTQDVIEDEKRVQMEHQELVEVATEIRVQEGKHEFGEISIQNSAFDQNQFINFNYAKEKTLRDYIRKLDSLQGKYKEKVNEMNREKSGYIAFCNRNIKDAKLKHAAINGVERKASYQELLDYQSQMEQMIERSIRIAEDDRRESDMELQTFLTHLNTYVKNIAIELDVIQKKTKIKVDDVVKQIFIFNIPEWNEHEAKEELRRYIESIVEYFDEETENGNQDEEAIRLSLEQKLSVKNLLNVVMKDQSIKIKCRKVTNDMKINKAPVIWESSNKWSGGEKWSKNMTLFLGLLNYLAEKKQYLSLEQKRHRTVILDNPFGKASSKHVLEPVFFIAEKLGFQIIALTAHAEGKFISDYFPVVYSGRLRGTVDSGKQIMTNERILNHAYLRAKSPKSLERMEEREQMSFFESSF